MTRKMTGKRTSKRPASKLKVSREPGGMSVREAGRLGGLIGGRQGRLEVKAGRGIEFYQEIGRLGGQRVRDLIAAGRQGGRRRTRRRGRGYTDLQMCPLRGAHWGEGWAMAEENAGRKKGSMSVSEAGRKGGQTVRDKYGHSFYEEIGRKGGETVKAERGRAFYEYIVKKAATTVKAERGAAFYETIGKKGGE